MKKLLIFIVLIGSMVGYGLYEKTQLETIISEADQSPLLSEVPSADFQKFNSTESLSIESVVKANRYTVVHFWATWCGPCEKEFPELLRLINKVGDTNIQFVLIAVNDNNQSIKKFLKPFNAISEEYELLMDNKQIHRQFFGISKLPETYIFDEKGRVIRSLIGPQDWTSPPFLKYFNNLAAQ